MHRFMTALMVCFVIASASVAQAQDVPEFPSPQEEHQWLKQFAGEWDSEAEANMGPDQPPLLCEGAMSSHMLGEFWVVSKLTNNMAGMNVTGIQTIGYDPEKEKYVGSWVDSMTSYIWRYEGWVDDSGKKLILEAEGPNFMEGGKTAKFRDAYEFKSKDHIVATSSMQGEDGEWTTFMTGHMRRKK